MTHWRTVQSGKKNETKKAEVWLLPSAEITTLSEYLRSEFALRKHRTNRMPANPAS